MLSSSNHKEPRMLVWRSAEQGKTAHSKQVIFGKDEPELVFKGKQGKRSENWMNMLKQLLQLSSWHLFSNLSLYLKNIFLNQGVIDI